MRAVEAQLITPSRLLEGATAFSSHTVHDLRLTLHLPFPDTYSV